MELERQCLKVYRLLNHHSRNSRFISYILRFQVIDYPGSKAFRLMLRRQNNKKQCSNRMNIIFNILIIVESQ